MTIFKADYSKLFDLESTHFVSYENADAGSLVLWSTIIASIGTKEQNP